MWFFSVLGNYLAIWGLGYEIFDMGWGDRSRAKGKDQEEN